MKKVVVPKGKYLLSLHLGPRSKRQQTVDKMKNYAKSKKLQLLENLDQSLNEVLKASDQSLSTTEAKYMFDKVDASVYKSAKNKVLQANYNELNNTLDKLYIQYQLQILRGE